MLIRLSILLIIIISINTNNQGMNLNSIEVGSPINLLNPKVGTFLTKGKFAQGLVGII